MSATDDPAEVPSSRVDEVGLSDLIERLKQGDEKFRLLVEHVPGVLYIDVPQRDFETLYVSPQVESMLGITPEEWSGEGEAWLDHIHPDDRARVLEAYNRFIATETGPDLSDYRMLRPDGSVVWVRDRARAVRDDQGRAVLEHGLMVDVTELKESQAVVAAQAEQLRRAEAIGRAFTDTVLREEGTDGILLQLARLCGNPVVLEDAARHLVGFAAHDQQPVEVLGAWERHSRSGHAAGHFGGVQMAVDPPCLWVTIRVRDEVWGRLHLLQLERTADQIDSVAIDRAAAALGITLLSQREAAVLAEQAGTGLLFDVMRGRITGEKEVRGRAKALGVDLGLGPLLALVVEPLGVSPPGFDAVS